MNEVHEPGPTMTNEGIARIEAGVDRWAVEAKRLLASVAFWERVWEDARERALPRERLSIFCAAYGRFCRIDRHAGAAYARGRSGRVARILTTIASPP